MKLYSLFNENHILLGESSPSLPKALRQLIQAFGTAIPPQMAETIMNDLLLREEQHPTVIDEKVCLPHMRIEGLDRFMLGLMVLETPVAHIVKDLAPVQAIFMILAPQNKNAMMLQTMAAIARLLQSQKTKQAIMNVRSQSRLIRLIEESGIDVKKTLLAGDIMTPITHTVTTDYILARAVDVLVDAPDEGVPVLNEKGKLVGELTSQELLKLGMPKYLDLLTDPTMLDSFEPFETFFQNENSMSVRELCRRDIISVEPNTPIVQVTHLMMTRHKRRVYVVDEGILKGVIFRKNIVMRVLHY